MAEYRTIRMAFWNDPFIEDLSSTGKLLYFYLFTCPHTNNLGLLEVSRKKIAFETGMSVDDVDALLAQLEQAGKIVTDEHFIWLVNFIRHQTATSEKMLVGLQALFGGISSDKIRGRVAERYPELSLAFHAHSKGMDTPSKGIAHAKASEIPIPEFKKEEEEEEEIKINTPPTPSRGERGEPLGAPLDSWADETNPVTTETTPRARGGKARDTDKNSRGTQAHFVPPAQDEVAAYCAERGNGILAQEFCDFYASKGWMVGKNRMKDWKAAVRTWENSRKQAHARDRPSPPPGWDQGWIDAGLPLN